MGQVATVTISAVSYSVYAITSDAVDDANDYFGGSLGAGAAAWAAATSDNKKRALVSAQRMIDRVSTWSGEKSSSSQPLEWPRDGAYCDDEALADGAVPDELAYAEFELAGLMLVDASIAYGSGTGSNVRSVKAGSAAVEFFSPTIGSSSDVRLPQVAHDLVKCLFGGTAGVGTPFASGTDEESDFDPDDFELCDGWS